LRRKECVIVTRKMSVLTYSLRQSSRKVAFIIAIFQTLRCKFHLLFFSTLSTSLTKGIFPHHFYAENQLFSDLTGVGSLTPPGICSTHVSINKRITDGEPFVVNVTTGFCGPTLFRAIYFT
jgi:hypothetical protein